MNNYDIINALGDVHRKATEAAVCVGKRSVSGVLDQALEDIRKLMELIQEEKATPVRSDDRLTLLEGRVALLESAERIITQGEVDKMLEQHTPRSEPDIPF